MIEYIVPAFRMDSSTRRIKSFALRFVSFEEVSHIPEEESQKYLDKVCQDSATTPPLQLSHLRFKTKTGHDRPSIPQNMRISSVAEARSFLSGLKFTTF